MFEISNNMFGILLEALAQSVSLDSQGRLQLGC
jgi:hypothetical protein